MPTVGCTGQSKISRSPPNQPRSPFSKKRDGHSGKGGKDDLRLWRLGHPSLTCFSCDHWPGLFHHSTMCKRCHLLASGGATQSSASNSSNPCCGPHRNLSKPFNLPEPQVRLFNRKAEMRRTSYIGRIHLCQALFLAVLPDPIQSPRPPCRGRDCVMV